MPRRMKAHAHTLFQTRVILSIGSMSRVPF
jgi:hypothetical protein